MNRLLVLLLVILESALVFVLLGKIQLLQTQLIVAQEPGTYYMTEDDKIEDVTVWAREGMKIVLRAKSYTVSSPLSLPVWGTGFKINNERISIVGNETSIP